MVLLKSLLEKVDYQLVSGDLEGKITSFVNDSRKIEKGCLFVAIKGEFFDGHDFVGEAIEKEAKAVVVNADFDTKGIEPLSTAVIKVADSRLAMALIAGAYYDYPSDKIGVIGITGTKGKTTTTYIIKAILDHAGLDCGLIGTIETIVGDKHTLNSNTTPESVAIQKALSEMVDKGMKYCVMEASSQGFMLHRTGGIDFKAGLITNLSPDHIGPNEHKDFEEYKSCKKMMFAQCKDGFFNMDDDHFDEMKTGAKCNIHTYGIDGDADIKGTDIELYTKGSTLGVSFKINGEGEAFRLPLPGYFSVYNALAAISVCRFLGVKDEVIREALLDVKVKGRIEGVKMPGNYSFFIDYSHNAVALESILKTLRVYEPGRLVSIFGCGGNRDKNRRYEMGDVSGRFADFTIITSDNPRYEEPLDIMKDIEGSLKKTGGAYVMVEDRKEAIRYAIKHALDGDIILLAGKGHEDYQEIKGVKHHMDEREMVLSVLEEEGLS